MRKLTLFLALPAMLAIHACKTEKVGSADLGRVIPRPMSEEVMQGHYTLKPGSTILLPLGSEALAAEAAWLARFLGKGSDVASESGRHAIRLSLEPSLADTLGAEGYFLQIDGMGISISAPTAAGVFYGMQTLRQILPAECEEKGLTRKVRLPYCHIADKPRFAWRGMLLDCCRHFMEKEFVMRYIDLLATHKMNRLHWHLTEDQGWRIEIDRYPLLTRKGAWRKGLTGEAYGGFYTKDDIREVVAYAAERHVMVVPEIEMPGHSLAALASYPELSCTGGPFEVATTWGVFKDIYCAGNDSVFSFLEGVLDEVCELFPSPYIHIGGDEAPKARWEECPKCQGRIAQEGLHDEHELQSWFIGRIAHYLEGKGRTIIGWDEILEGGLPDQAIVQSWRGMSGALEAAQAGSQAIVSPTSHAYFDYSLATTDLEKVYSFEPIPEGLDPALRHLILGGECNMWTERAPQDLVDSKVFPRILAMAEVLWTTDRGSYESFLRRVRWHYERLDKLGVAYGPESDLARFVVESSDSSGMVVVAEPGQPGMDFHFLQLDMPAMDTVKHGTALGSPVRFQVKGDDRIVVHASLDSRGAREDYVRDYAVHLAMGHAPQYVHAYSPSYPASGALGLVDGVRGTRGLHDGNWQGFEGEDMDVLIDLGDVVPISFVSCGFLQANPSWVFMPVSVHYELLGPGKELRRSLDYKSGVSPAFVRDTIDYIGGAIPATRARYVRVRAGNMGTCPDWHPGQGMRSWVFADEIIIR